LSFCVEMVLSKISEPSCKLQTLQKDLRLAINMSDSVDQPLHVGAAVNEVSALRYNLSFLYFSARSTQLNLDACFILAKIF